MSSSTPKSPPGGTPSSAPEASRHSRLLGSRMEVDTVAAQYRRRQILGLLLLAVVILAGALYRADTRILFPPGWWRF